MKKIIVCLVVVMLCVSMVAPAIYAAEFTPSVENKPAPELVPVVDENGNPRPGYVLLPDGEKLYLDEDCLIVTSVAEADISVDIPKTAKDLLLWLYQQLMRGDMKMPYQLHNPKYNSDSMTIRDMFDITFLCGDHPEALEDAGVVLVLTFAIPGLQAGQDVSVMTYKEADGGWNDIEKIVNNGDGTVTCTFEHLCPVAFSVANENGVTPPEQTGDTNTFGVWGIVALVSLGAIAALTYVYYRSTKKNAQ